MTLFKLEKFVVIRKNIVREITTEYFQLSQRLASKESCSYLCSSGWLGALTKNLYNTGLLPENRLDYFGYSLDSFFSALLDFPANFNPCGRTGCTSSRDISREVSEIPNSHENPDPSGSWKRGITPLVGLNLQDFGNYW